MSPGRSERKWRRKRLKSLVSHAEIARSQAEDLQIECTHSDGWFRVSLAWMIFAVAVQTKGFPYLLVAAM